MFRVLHIVFFVHYVLFPIMFYTVYHYAVIPYVMTRRTPTRAPDVIELL